MKALIPILIGLWVAVGCGKTETQRLEEGARGEGDFELRTGRLTAESQAIPGPILRTWQFAPA